MKRAQKIAKECSRKTIAITCDPAITKSSTQLQAEESPTYDNLFINMGGFHIELAFFSALGKYIEESGGLHVLQEASVIRKFSLKSFIMGKAYNRCKRIYHFFAATLEILHMQVFLNRKEEDCYEQLVCNEIENIRNGDNYTSSKEVQDMLDDYKEYFKETKTGKYGKTAQFRLATQNGCIFTIFAKFASLLFALNHQNYALWLVRYHDNLLKLRETYPEVYKDFQEKCFAIKRTQKDFSALPIDLTLEQTITADAASQKSGIISLTNSIGARQRWARSHFLRTKIISYVFEKVGMSEKEDVTQDLRPDQMKKNKKHLQNSIETLQENMNPFRESIDKESSFIIGSGKAALTQTAVFLLSIMEKGWVNHGKFIQECIDQPKRFEDKITRNKLLRFASEGKPYRLRSDNKVASVQIVRDLFGSIPFLSLQHKTDMEEVLSYPLTPIPLSLCHIDSLNQTTPKIKLLYKLESRIPNDMPPNIHATVTDAMFFLHLQKTIPGTFEALPSYLLIRICAEKGNELHMVFDKVQSPSTKDCERDER